MNNLALKKEKMLILLLCGVQVVHILDFVIIMPLGPVLMRAFDILPAQFGLLVSSYHISAGICGLFLGAISNKYDKKFLLLTLFAFFILSTYLCAIASSYDFFLMARVLAGAFGGIINSLIFTIVTDLIPYERRGKAMGSIISSFSVASVAGVPIGLMFSDLYSWHASFYFIIGLSIIISIFLIYIFPKIPVSENKRSIRLEIKTLFQTLTNKDYIPGYALIGMLACSGFMLFPYLSTFAVNNMGIAESEVKYIYLSGGFFTVLTSQIIGKKTDKHGPLKVFLPLILCTFPIIIGYTSLQPLKLSFVLIIATFFMVFMSGRIIPIMTLLSQIPKELDRGSFMSAQNSCRTFVSAFATYIAGTILVETPSGKLENFNYVGYISITISIFAILLAIYINKRVKV